MTGAEGHLLLRRSGSLLLPASWPVAGKGASARSLLVKPALSEASAGLARALTVNPRAGGLELA